VIFYSFSERGPQKLYKLLAPQNMDLPQYLGVEDRKATANSCSYFELVEGLKIM
jgi:hypothetical protein